MKVGIIGAGKLGCALAIGLKSKGFEITGVFSRTEESAVFLCNSLAIPLSNCLENTVKKADVVFITVPDSQIGNMAKSIASNMNDSAVSEKTFFHCSGALGSDVLIPLAENGAFTASFHPIQTFADRVKSWKGLDNIYFGFEGANEAKEKAEQIVKAFDSKMLVIEIEDKALYHAAACILSNYTVTLSYVAGKLFEKIGIDVASGIKAFTPLVGKTVRNIEELGSLNALTGPISRGDDRVVEKHLKEIESKFPEAALIYKVLGMMTVKAALEKGSIDREAAARMIELL